MRIILHSSSLYIFGAGVLIVAALFLLFSVFSHDDKTLITSTVERGTVSEIVSVSGVVEAKNTAQLAFPVTGIVTDVLVDEGDVVSKGAILATLASAQLAAERSEAAAALQKAIADRDELVAGPRSEQRSVTSQTITNAEENLKQVITEQDEKVKNAKRTLLSTSLEARTTEPTETAASPTVSGTYICTEGGTYTIDVYRSGAYTNYSYRVSGLELGTYTVFTESPGSFGSCGLSLQFDADSLYNLSSWTIDIPNTRSSAYQTNLNAYELALKQRENAIATAENTLALAREEANLSNANPRSEALARAQATVAQAAARIAVIDARIADRSIVAPFDGTITNVAILPGETAGSAPVITILAADAFELVARIPEIDITKIAEGQKTDIVFDARAHEIISGTIEFISPLAIEIDGVAYFEARIILTDAPNWIRSGLNADIDITTEERVDVLRIPKRFLIEENDSFAVLVPHEDTPQLITVERGFVGNDGFVEINGLNEGDTIVAP